MFWRHGICVDCGTSGHVDRHSLTRQHKSPFVDLCPNCHRKRTANEGYTTKTQDTPLLEFFEKRVRERHREQLSVASQIIQTAIEATSGGIGNDEPAKRLRATLGRCGSEIAIANEMFARSMGLSPVNMLPSEQRARIPRVILALIFGKEP